jgi:putative transposase
MDKAAGSTKIVRNFRFKLKPSAAQHNRLREALERSRQLYNAALEERVDCYRKTGKGRSYFDQCKALTEVRKEDSTFAWAMDVAPLKALDGAYKAFFRRGGFPRFKGRDWYKSIAWAARGGWSFCDGRFYAKGIGRIRVQQDRAVPSSPKTATVKREGKHWFLSVTCEIEAATNDNFAAIGIDLGLSTFAALSDGTLVPSPRHGRTGHAEMKRRQRALARCKRGSKRRRKARERVAVAHLKQRRARRTHHFQTASDLCRRFGLIAIENLNVKGLARSALARDVNDAAWGQFIQILCDKAESAGVQVVKVDPRHTSQTCPECGVVEPKKLSERVHRCPCGYEADRDVAAARVILMRAVQSPMGVNVGGCAVRSPRKAA